MELSRILAALAYGDTVTLTVRRILLTWHDSNGELAIEVPNKGVHYNWWVKIQSPEHMLQIVDRLVRGEVDLYDSVTEAIEEITEY